MSRRNLPAQNRRISRSESRSSKAYEAGKAIRYSGRINGPTFPVTTYSVDDLPDDSALFPGPGVTFDPSNDIDLGTKLGTGKAYE